MWQKAHHLVLKIYKTTLLFPKEELFGLSRQMRNSCSSIPTNISEGCGRATNPDFKRFLSIAIGSCSELEYQLLLAKDLNYINKNLYIELHELVIEIRKMIYTYMQKLD